MSWDNIIGQDRVKQVLINALKHNKLAGSFLFSGPRGVGKDFIAFELAKVLNCSAGSGTACDICADCVKFKTLQHPNLKLVFALPVGENEKYGDSPLAKLTKDDISVLQQQIQMKAKNPYHKILLPRANTIKINSIREIRKESAMTPFGGGKKVFIIIDAENLNDESSNSLLKTLEESLPDTVLILTTSQPEILLPTIVSRCRHIRFDYLTVGEIRSGLRDYEKVDEQRADWVARSADGSYYRALAMSDPVSLRMGDEAVEFIRTVLYKTRYDLIRLIEHIIKEYGKPEIEEFFYMLQNWLRSSMIHREESLGGGRSEADPIVKKFASAHPELNYSPLFEAIDRSVSLLGKNVYIPLILINLAADVRKIVLSGSSLKKNDISGA